MKVRIHRGANEIQVHYVPSSFTAPTRSLRTVTVDADGSQHKPNTILIEDKASGTSLIQDLKADGVFQVAAYAPPTGTDKTMRLNAQTALFENGLVFLPRQAPWLHDYRVELTSFPGGKHDDQVDSTTQALDYPRTKTRS